MRNSLRGGELCMTISYGCYCPEKGRLLQSNMMAMAIRIMRTWWYPKNGINPTLDD